MRKFSGLAVVLGATLSVAALTTPTHAATIANGATCANANKVSNVKVKGATKAYICKVNPAIPGATALTWTLKTCISYWAAAQNSQDSITQQRALVQSMSDPDKTTYTKQLDASQASLDKVKSTIVSGYCKAGL
jgi:hypothetical protein